MIESLNNYRKTIDEMLKLIYDKINNIYSNLIEDKNILNQNLNNINEKFEKFKSHHNELLNKVKNFMSFNNNFEIYNKHLSLLDSIHENCEFNRIKLMSNYFTIPISQLEDTYLTENLIKDIKENLDSKALEIINLIKNNYPVSSSLLNYENEAKNILTNYFGKNLTEKYFDIYTYDSFLINQTKKFYDDLSQYFEEFYTIFYKNNFENENENYVDVPNEILTKLTQIIDYQKNYKDHPAEQLNEIIYNSLNNLISESYEKLKIIIKNDYNLISSNINKSNSTLVNEIDEFFDSLISFIETEKNSKKQKNSIKSILNLSDDDPFKLKSNSSQKENNFYSNLNIIKNNVESSFKKNHCQSYENLKTCKMKILNLNELHNFNMAKIRNEIEHYKIIQNYFGDLLTDDLLVDLSGKKFSDLFLENIDFSGESIKNAILNFIKKKNDEELEIFNPFINQFKNSYKQVFEENLNEQMITNKLEILANSAFENKIIIDNSNFIDLIKQKFKTFDEKWINLQFYLHSNDLQNSYNSFVNNLKKILFSIKNFVDNLTLEHIIIRNTSDEYKSIIFKKRREFLKKINEKEHDDCVLLNLTFNLKDIGKDAIDELKDAYYLHIESETERIYNIKFVELKTNIKNLIDEKVNEILNTLNTEYESIYLNLSEKSNPECQQTDTRPNTDSKCKNRKDVQLKNLENDLISSIINYANTYKSEIETNFAQTKIKEQIEQIDKESILDQEFNFDEIENKVVENANNFKKICSQNLEKEKTEFQTEINNIIENHFIENINYFANGFGINFMEENFNKIYLYSIKNKFNYINSIFINTNSYINNDLISYIDKIELNLKDLLLNVYKESAINIEIYSENVKKNY